MIPKSRRWGWHLGAFGLYAALAIVLLDDGASLTRNILGITSDPMLSIWFLAWWPWALAHHMDPLFTNLVWHQSGIDLVWTTCIPALALLGLPVTLLGGPVLAYNVLTLLAPVLSAVSAYALCLYITKRPSAALLGGLCFGFSTYEMSEAVAHLNLDFNAAVPCLALVILARLDNLLRRDAAVGLAGGLLALQFYVSVEVAATALLFGGICWVLAVFLLEDRRRVLCRLVVDGVFAGLLTGVLVFPLLWNMLTIPRGTETPLGGWDYVSAGHLFNLLVTTPRVVLSDPGIAFTGRSLIGHIPQYDFSTGLLLAAFIGAYFFQRWPAPDIRLLCYLLLIIMVASLGPQLWIGGHFSSIMMPWYFMLRVPLVNSALPVRFMLYSSLIVAVVVACWIAEAEVLRSFWVRVACAAFAFVITLTLPHDHRAAPYSNFFQPGGLQAVLGEHAQVLILPDATDDKSTFWQAENQFGFVQLTGYLGMPPLAMRKYAAVNDIMFNKAPPGLAQDIAGFCHATGASFVLAGPDVRPGLRRAMMQLSWPSRQMDDVTIFTVPVHG
jgi:hypothetical protein